MSYAAKIFGIFYSQWDYQMVNISMILKFLTWQGFDEFGWNDPAFNLLSNTFCCLLVLGAKYPDSRFDSSRDLLDQRLLSTLESLLLNQATCGQHKQLKLFTNFCSTNNVHQLKSQLFLFHLNCSRLSIS